MDSVEEIKLRLNVVDVVSSYIKLTKAGASFKGLCPFHKEKTPSFIVSPARQSWHCFGCNEGGDFISFVMKMEGIEFPDALELLAKRAGVTIERQSSFVRSERSKLLSILEEAAKFYQSALEKNPLVREYLEKERGLLSSTIKEFRIGFAPNEWRSAVEHLSGLGYGREVISRAGLAIKNESKKDDYYDRFRGRIIFPIFDNSGEVIGFGGRIFGLPTDSSGAQAKYINTPETPVYSKGKVLYGFDRAKDAIRREGKAIIVEGYTDVILSWQSGVKNVVAVSGTALGELHLRRLKFLADTLLLSFDMDEAGFQAARRVIELAQAHNFSVKALPLPDGQDPADVARTSAELWKGTVESAKPVVEFFMDGFLKTVPSQSLEAKLLVREKVLPLLQAVSSVMERAHWVAKIATRLSVPESSVWQDLQNTKRVASPQRSGAVAPESSQAPLVKSRLEIMEEYALALLVLYPESISDVDKTDSVFSCELPIRMWSALRGKGFPQASFVSLIPQLSEEELRVMNHWLLKAEFTTSALKDPVTEAQRGLEAISRIKTQNILASLGRGVKDAEARGDSSQRDELIRKFNEHTRKL